MLYNAETIDKKQLIDQLIQEKNKCLNEFSSLTVSISNNNLLHKQIHLLAMKDLEKLLFTYYHHGISTFDNKNLNQLSYPKEFFNFTISGDLKHTPDYSEYYTLYI